MKDASKPPQGSAIASDLKAIFSMLRTRRTKVFLYAFAFAFVSFTAYLAFFPTEKASPWFNNLFNSASVSSAPYRSQISSIFSSIFPNSSSSPSPGNAAFFPVNLPVDGGDDRKGGVLGGNLTSVGGGPPAGRASGKEAVGGSPGSGILAENETADGGGIKKGGEKNMTTSGIGLTGDGDSKRNSTMKGGNGGSSSDQGKNQKGSGVQSKNETTSGVAPVKSSDSPSKNQTKVGDGSKKDAAPVAKNMTVAGAPSKNQTASRVASAVRNQHLILRKMKLQRQRTKPAVGFPQLQRVLQVLQVLQPLIRKGLQVYPLHS